MCVRLNIRTRKGRKRTSQRQSCVRNDWMIFCGHNWKAKNDEGRKERTAKKRLG